MRILLVTDAFPPRAGGSGWSTHALARGLQGRGHEVEVVRPLAGLRSIRRRVEHGVDLTEFGWRAAPVPLLRGVLRDELLPRRLAAYLAKEIANRKIDVVHAQHWTSAMAAIPAARAAGRPVAVTVRDYWPVCYFTTWHHGGGQCPGCGPAARLACAKLASPRGFAAAIPLAPWMDASVARRRARLAEADLVVAVSEFVAAKVVRPIAGPERTRVIPNLVELGAVEARSREAPRAALPDRFVLFAGKLSPTKGAALLAEIAARLGPGIRLVVVGEGPAAAALDREAARGALVRLPWMEPDELHRVLGRAAAVVFPSQWPEPLSRLVLEAMAAGAPVVAADAGGIHDQVEDGVSGRIVPAEPAALAAAASEIAGDGALRARLAEGARRRLAERFSPGAVLPAVELAYEELLQGARR